MADSGYHNNSIKLFSKESFKHLLQGIAMHEFNKTCLVCEKQLKLIRKDRPPRFCSSICSLKINRHEPQVYWKKDITFKEIQDRLRIYFEKNVIKGNDCWDWKGYLSGGYGLLSMSPKLIAAHRASWMIHNGEIPKDKIVLHKCDNRKCTNPTHLYLGTHQDNSNDKYNRKRDRHVKGESHRCAKLKTENVIQIRQLLAENKALKEIARMFNVNYSIIYFIKHGRTWRSV